MPLRCAAPNILAEPVSDSAAPIRTTGPADVPLPWDPPRCWRVGAAVAATPAVAVVVDALWPRADPGNEATAEAGRRRPAESERAHVDALPAVDEHIRSLGGGAGFVGDRAGRHGHVLARRHA